MRRIYFWLFALALLLISFNRVFQVGQVRSFSRVVLSPISYGLYFTASNVYQGVDLVAKVPLIYKENQELQDQINQLNSYLVQLTRLKEENDALRYQLDVQGQREIKKFVVKVLGFHEDHGSVVLLINKGLSDGVKLGSIVVRGDQLIGRVVEVDPFHSFVLPVFAVSSRIPVEIIPADSGLLSDDTIKGLALGRFNNQVVLSDVLQEDRLGIGDLVITSGEGKVFPPGLLIGKVASIESNKTEPFQKAFLQIFWKLGEVNTVFVYDV